MQPIGPPPAHAHHRGSGRDQLVAIPFALGADVLCPALPVVARACVLSGGSWGCSHPPPLGNMFASLGVLMAPLALQEMDRRSG
jgi:hypothetical protein